MHRSLSFSSSRLGTACLLVIGLLSSLYLQAQNGPAEEPLPGSGLLWRISGNELTHNSYLFGTASAVCPAELEINRPVVRCLQLAEQLILTLDITNPNLSQQVLQEMQLPPGQNISQWFTQTEYFRVEEFYRDSLGISLQQLARYQPLYVSSYLFAWVLNCPALSYEQELARQMQLQHKPIYSLESVADQGRTFRQIPYREQAKLVVVAVDQPEQLKAYYTDMIVSYRNQDLPSLYAIGKELNLGMNQYEEVLLDNRNRRWIPKIEAYMQQASSFIAVNTTHLAGPNGLLAMLRRRGYMVEVVEY